MHKVMRQSNRALEAEIPPRAEIHRRGYPAPITNVKSSPKGSICWEGPNVVVPRLARPQKYGGSLNKWVWLIERVRSYARLSSISDKPGPGRLVPASPRYLPSVRYLYNAGIVRFAIILEDYQDPRNKRGYRYRREPRTDLSASTALRGGSTPKSIFQMSSSQRRILLGRQGAFFASPWRIKNLRGVDPSLKVKVGLIQVDVRKKSCPIE